MHSLSDAISREKIAAFKAKRLAKKRATIKPGDDLAGGAVSLTIVNNIVIGIVLNRLSFPFLVCVYNRTEHS